MSSYREFRVNYIIEKNRTHFKQTRATSENNFTPFELPTRQFWLFPEIRVRTNCERVRYNMRLRFVSKRRKIWFVQVAHHSQADSKCSSTCNRAGDDCRILRFLRNNTKTRLFIS